MDKESIAYTLGPAGTDSYNALIWWLNIRNYNVTVKVVDEFETAFQLAIKNDIILMPAGYQNRREGSEYISWIDFHFHYYEKVVVEDYFMRKTMAMALVENVDYEIDSIILHSSTYQLYRINEKTLNNKDISFASSKISALDAFLINKYRYAIVSYDELSKRLRIAGISIKILRMFEPEMIWVIYKMKG